MFIKLSKVLTLLLIFNLQNLFCVTSGADFLDIPKNARAVALGDAFSAIINDASAIDYNPASLYSIQNLSLSTMFQSWIENSFSIYFSGAYKIKSFFLGFSIFYFDYGDFYFYDYYGYNINFDNPYRFFDLNTKLAIATEGKIFNSLLNDLNIGIAFSLIIKKYLENNF